MIDNENLLTVLPLLREEYDKATIKHPTFPSNPAEGVCIIEEELGELAKEINDEDAGWRERATIEAMHVAVTALRMAATLKANDCP